MGSLYIYRRPILVVVVVFCLFAGGMVWRTTSFVTASTELALPHQLGGHTLAVKGYIQG